MEDLKCLGENCYSEDLKVCYCRFPPAFVCDDHKSIHMKEIGNHEFESLPESFCRPVKHKVLHINDDFYESQKYFISPGTDIMNYFKLETSEIDLPLDYCKNFDEMTNIFVSEVLKIPRGETKLIQDRCILYINAIKYVVANINIDNNKFVSDLSFIFDSMHSKIETELNELLNVMIDHLLTDKVMKFKAGWFGTKSVENIKLEFFASIMLKARTLEDILGNFFSFFKDFLPPQDFLIKYINNFENSYNQSLEYNTNQTTKKIFDYASSCYKNLKYYKLAIYKPTASSQKILESTIKPEWIEVYNVLVKLEPIELLQSIEITPNNILVVLSFKTSSIYHFVCISEYFGTFIKEYVSQELFLASGSLPQSLIIIENYPRRCTKARIDESKLIEENEIHLDIENYFTIKSAIYIDNIKSILFATNNNQLFIQNIKNGSSKKKIGVNFHQQERVANLKYKNSKNLILVRTTNYLYFFNHEIEEIFKFQTNGMDVELADTENCVFFYTISIKSIDYWPIAITKDDLKKLSVKPRKTENFSFIASKLVKTIGVIMAGDTSKKDIYSHLINKFSPLNIKPSGELINTVVEINQRPLSQTILKPDKNTQRMNSSLIEEFEKLHETSANAAKTPGIGSIPPRIPIEEFKLEVSNKTNIIPPNQASKSDIPNDGLSHDKCDLCGQLAFYHFPDDFKLCENSHNCRSICEKEGICSNTGKLNCCKIIPEGKKSHEGPHLCEKEKSSHSCDAKCPMPNCVSYCYRTFGHKGLHKNDFHQNLNEDEGCSEFCFARTHKHFIDCKGGQNCGEIKYPGIVKHCRKRIGTDKCSCDTFWGLYNWENI
jgi:hypothetical protein